MEKAKKGFTVVELVIVIAVIAILVSVLIPTFSTLINKANVSKDTQLCRVLNEELKVQEAETGYVKPETYSDLLAKISDKHTIQNLTPTSKGDIVWDQNTNTFALIENNKMVYKYNDKVKFDESKANINLWKIVSEVPTNLADQKYSMYLKDNANVTPATVAVGFDAGNNINITSLTYDRSTATEGQDVIIRTNGGTLTINAPKDTVKHYGEATVLNIEAVATSSYHEFGTVANAQIKAGRIVIENSEASIDNLLLIAESDKSGFKDIVVETKTGAELPTFDRTDVNIAENGTLVLNVVTPSTAEYIYLTKAGVVEQIVVTTEEVDTATTNVTTVESTKTASETSETTQAVAEQVANVGKKNDDGKYVDSNGAVVELDSLTSVSQIETEAKADDAAVQTGLTVFAGGVGTKNSPYLISTETQMRTIGTNTYNGKYLYYKQINDITVTTLTSKRFYHVAYFQGEYDGDGYYVSVSETHSDAYGAVLFCEANKNAVVKNINVVSHENCAFSVFYDLTGGFATSVTLQNITTSCKDGKTVKANAGNMGFFAQNPIYNTSSHQQTIIFENCVNKANLENSGTCSAAFIGSGYCSGYKYLTSSSEVSCPEVLIAFKNCKNEGNITTTKTGGYAGVVWGNPSYNNNYIKPTTTDINKGMRLYEDATKELILDWITFEESGLVNTGVISATYAHAFAEAKDASEYILNTTYQNIIGGTYAKRAELTGEYTVVYQNGELKVYTAEDKGYSFKLGLSVSEIRFASGNVANGRNVEVDVNVASNNDGAISTGKIHAYDYNTAVSKGIINSSTTLVYNYSLIDYEAAIHVNGENIYIIVKTIDGATVDSGITAYLYAFNASGASVGSKIINQ